MPLRHEFLPATRLVAGGDARGFPPAAVPAQRAREVGANVIALNDVKIAAINLYSIAAVAGNDISLTCPGTADDIAGTEFKIDALLGVAAVERTAGVDADVISIDLVTTGAGAKENQPGVKIAGDDVPVSRRSTADRVGGRLNPDSTLIGNIGRVIGMDSRTVCAYSQIVSGDEIVATQEQDAVIDEVLNNEATDR